MAVAKYSRKYSKVKTGVKTVGLGISIGAAVVGTLTQAAVIGSTLSHLSYPNFAPSKEAFKSGIYNVPTVLIDGSLKTRFDKYHIPNVNSINTLEIDNKALLIKETIAPLSTREIAFSQTAGKLLDRSADLRDLYLKPGAWTQVSNERREYDYRTMRQNIISAGFDIKQDTHLLGLMASYTRGDDKGRISKENHMQAGVALYYAWEAENSGIFVDTAAGFQRVNQNLDFNNKINKLKGAAQSNMLMASIKLGYKTVINDNKAYVTPSIELLGGHINAYTLSNNEVSIKQTSGNPLYIKTGVQVGNTWTSLNGKKITLSAGAYRKQSINKNASKIVLADRYAAHSYTGWHDNGYELNIKASGQIKKNLSIDISAQSNIGNKGKTDLKGQFGVQYRF